MGRMWWIGCAAMMAGCVFTDLEEPGRVFVEPDTGSSTDVGGEVDAGADMGEPDDSFAVVATESFGQANVEGARVGFGPIVEGFAAVQLTGSGSVTAHTVNYSGTTSESMTVDFADQVVGGVTAIAPIFDAAVDETGFFFTTSVTPSELVVSRCTFSTQTCVDRFGSGFDRGTDMAIALGADTPDVAFVTNDGGGGLWFGGVTRNPFDVSVTDTEIGGGETASLSLRTGGGVNQLAWIDTGTLTYQTGRWRAGSFSDGPNDCGTVAGAAQQIVPVAVTGTVLLIREGVLAAGVCKGDGIVEVDLGLADGVGVGDFALSNTGSLREFIAWRTTDDDIYAAELDVGTNTVSRVTLVANVPLVQGLAITRSADDDRIGLLTWGTALRAFVLSP